MTVSLLTIGTELTRGELFNKNAQTIAELLTERGYEVTEVVTVDDEDNRIVSALRRLGETSDLLIVTGGLGPTTDDRTSHCAALALGVPLKRNEPVLAQIRQLFSSRGVTFSPSNEKQADFPEGALILENRNGTAPGFCVRLKRATALFFPGVPREMLSMLEAALPVYAPPPKREVACRRLKTFGMPEAEVGERLAGVEEQFQVTLGYRASQAEIEVKVLATSGEGLAPPAQRAESALSAVRERLGEVAYADGQQSLAEHVGGLLRDRGLTFGLAESCTGGLVSEMMTAQAGASDFYAGGICSYDNRIKRSLLGVPEEVLERFGAVSEETARAMAEGARTALDVDVALSLTGIAGPGGGTEQKPVGLVHFAVATGDGTLTKHRIFRGSRSEIRRRAALFGLFSVRQWLLSRSD